MENREFKDLFEQLDYLDEVQSVLSSYSSNETYETSLMYKTITSYIWDLYSIKSGKSRPTGDFAAFMATERGGVELLDHLVLYTSGMRMELRFNNALVPSTEILAFTNKERDLKMLENINESLKELKKLKTNAQ